MNRIVLILVFVFAATVLSAKISVDESFEALTSSTSEAITEAFQRKDFSEAIALIEEWLDVYEKLPWDKKAQYKHQKINGFYLATCAQLARGDINAALDEFDKLVAIGYANFKQASTDRLLEPLRRSSRFERALAIVRQRGDHLTVLKSSGPYKYQKIQQQPKFIYAPNDPRTESFATISSLIASPALGRSIRVSSSS